MLRRVAVTTNAAPYNCRYSRRRLSACSTPACVGRARGSVRFDGGLARLCQVAAAKNVADEAGSPSDVGGAIEPARWRESMAAASHS